MTPLGFDLLADENVQPAVVDGLRREARAFERSPTKGWSGIRISCSSNARMPMVA